MKKLSVIVRIYNAEKTLHRCVDSILNQTFSDLEVILVDDGSTDSSWRICEEYARCDDRVVAFHKENAGPTAACKSGIELASGEYVGFVDSDDYIDADMYASMMAEIAKTEAEIVIGGIIIDYVDHSKRIYNGLPAGYYDRNDIEKMIIPKMLKPDGFNKSGIMPGIPLKLFKKTLLEKSVDNVWDGLVIGEDLIITSYALTLAQGVSIIERAAYHYAQTENSIIRGYNPKRFEHICNLYKCMSQIDDPAYKNQIGAYFACLLYNALAECAKSKYLKKQETIKMMRSMIENEVSSNALKNADVSNWEWKDKIKVYFMKNKLVHILYAIFTRKR